MIVTDISLRKLSPSEGMKLTNGTDYPDGDIYLGINDSPDNWYEITNEEYEAILAEKERLAKEKLGELTGEAI
jgi:hypothetical protein